MGEDVHDHNYHGAAYYANGDYASCHAPLNNFPNPPDPYNWSCLFAASTGGANFCLADGSIRFVAQTIDWLPYQQLCTRNGGEAVQVP